MDSNTILMTVSAALLLISAVLYFLTAFWGKFKKNSRVREKALEAVADCSEGEFRLKLAKHMKEMEGSQKELIELLKNQNTLLQAQVQNLENEICRLSEKQVNQTKSIIKFNKENARQLAISERETLEYIMLELKKAIEDNAGDVTVRKATEEPAVAEEFLFTEEMPVIEEPEAILEEVSETELFEVYDLPADEEFDIPDLPDPEEVPDLMAEPMTEDLPLEDILAVDDSESTDDFDLSALFDDLAEGALAEEEIPEESAPAEEEKTEEPAPAEDPLAGFGTDPNAMMTPEEIAKLLEAMGQ